MKIIYGKFNVEEEWEDVNRVAFPKAKSNDKIVRRMEELLFSISVGGTLLLNDRFDENFKKYLHKFGFHFDTLLIENLSNTDLFDAEIIAYAVNQELINMLDRGCRTRYPELADVIRVNGKDYSCSLIGKENLLESSIITSLEELDNYALLHEYNFMLKEPGGVSGKGNIHLCSKNQYLSLFRYFDKQIQKGKILCMIAERFVEVGRDFSSHYLIEEDGTLKFVCTRCMVNKGSKYIGSFKASENLMRYLREMKYFIQLESALNKIYQDGYWGEVCFDSMILKDGRLIPIVEINARKSMGLLSHYIEKHIVIPEMTARFLSIDIIVQEKFNFSILYDYLQINSLLIRKKGDRGIFLSSANTYDCDVKNRRGRIYFYVVADRETDEKAILDKFKSILSKQKISIV